MTVTDGFENYTGVSFRYIYVLCNLLVRSPVVQRASCFKGSVSFLTAKLFYREFTDSVAPRHIHKPRAAVDTRLTTCPAGRCAAHYRYRYSPVCSAGLQGIVFTCNRGADRLLSALLSDLLSLQLRSRHEAAERSLTGPACLCWMRCVTARGQASHLLSLVRGLL